ncbi:MAG: TlpA family protein disulfide reductase [Bacteroides sp.]|nr:TlpA family protein disulfide reductase [Bacteroides sp.]
MKKLMLMMVMLVSALWGQAQEHELKIGEALPGFELKSSVYGNVKPADLKGKVVLVSLFATWCGPCQKELAEVQSTLWPKYKDNKNFVMLVIGREHTDEQLQKYNERKKFTFPLYPDPKREVFSLFAEKSIPRAYLFGKDGKLIYSSVGYTAEEFQKLMETIEKAL